MSSTKKYTHRHGSNDNGDHRCTSLPQRAVGQVTVPGTSNL